MGAYSRGWLGGGEGEGGLGGESGAGRAGAQRHARARGAANSILWCMLPFRSSSEVGAVGMCGSGASYEPGQDHDDACLLGDDMERHGWRERERGRRGESTLQLLCMYLGACVGKLLFCMSWGSHIQQERVVHSDSNCRHHHLPVAPFAVSNSYAHFPLPDIARCYTFA